ncbi:MAG: uroporphyrinogen-III C-methyltransferase, partial [Gammaproteobacteria bacterium]|nr:uroporphyrinogen-III C-methyltransferase [Gammaproteobacteria bacterium]
MNESAKVYLVGTGPGDPDLLTVKALRLLQNADVVIYDRLVSEGILEQIPTGVSKIYVGKQTGNHTLPQDEINELLIKLAETKRTIVRLKGGDPFIFGRGSEEALLLAQNGIRFEVVPGITAASACTTYAGIPLTHRGLSQGVQIVTGHSQSDRPLELDWASLADENKTTVIYMGLANIELISIKLIDAGLPASTPAAAIQNGT